MRTAHKDVTILLVGTGVLDCPLARKFDTQKAKINPDRFFCRGSFILFDKLEFIYPLYLFCLYLYLAKLYPNIKKSNPSIGTIHPFRYH